MKQKTYDIATTKGLHHQDRKYHSPHPEDIFVKTGPEQGLPINLNMLNHPKRWQFKVNKVNTCRTNHSWQVFMTTVGFQRIFYICLFFKWIHLFHKFHHSKDQQSIYYTLFITGFNELFRNTLRQKTNKCNSPFFPPGNTHIAMENPPWENVHW